MPITTSIDDLIPGVLAFCEEHRDEFLAEFPRPAHRLLARAGWWIFTGLLPAGIRAAYTFYLARVARLTIAELLAMLTRDLRALNISTGVFAMPVTQFDWSRFVKFAPIALQVAISMIPAGGPVYILLSALLTFFPAPAGHAVQAAGPPIELPPEEHWTHEGLASWAQSRATAP